MGVQVGWVGQGVRLNYEGRYRWEEHDAAIQVMNQLMAGADRPVDLIIEIAPGAKLPPGSLQKIGLILRGRYPHWSRRAVVVSQSQIPQMMIELALRVFSRVLVDYDFRFVASLEAACAMLGPEAGSPEAGSPEADSLEAGSPRAESLAPGGMTPEIL